MPLQLDVSKIEVFCQSQMHVPWPKYHIRYNGEGQDVPEELVKKMCFDFEYGKALVHDKVLMLKEAIKFDSMKYIPFEEIKQ